MVPRSPLHFSVRIRDRFLWIEVPRRQIVIDGWPVMKAWTRRVGKEGWQRCRPHVDLATGAVAPQAFLSCGVPVLPLRRAQREAVDAGAAASYSLSVEGFAIARHYFSRVPAEIARVVSRFTYRQWHMLELVARRGLDAFELIASNQALGFCVASRRSFGPEQPSGFDDALGNLLRMRRRDICGCLGFPAKEGVVRILSKIEPEDCRLAALLALRGRLRSRRVFKTLGHLTGVNGAVLAALQSKFHASVTSAFLSELALCADEEAEESTRELLKAAGKAHQELRRRHLPKARFRRLEELRAFVAAADAEISETRRRAILDLEFPPPPLPQTKMFCAIYTPVQLLEEAGKLHHCADAYAPKVAAGEIYFYRMFCPQRATICVAKTPDGWRLLEVAGFGNQPVWEEVLELIQAWLSSPEAEPESAGTNADSRTESTVDPVRTLIS